MRNGYRAPSPAGKALSVDIVFSTYAYIRSDNARKAAFSYRSLPHWGRGTASAMDRVLSQTAYLRRSLPLVFHTASPSNLRPFGAPPSIGRRECPREPLPLEGAAERREAGLASFLRRSAAFVNGLLETIFPALFHTASTLSGSLRSPPSPRGEGFVRHYCFSTYACICSDNARKAASSFRSLPHWEGGPRQRWIGCSRKRHT